MLVHESSTGPVVETCTAPVPEGGAERAVPPCVLASAERPRSERRYGTGQRNSSLQLIAEKACRGRGCTVRGRRSGRSAASARRPAPRARPRGRGSRTRRPATARRGERRPARAGPVPVCSDRLAAASLCVVRKRTQRGHTHSGAIQVSPASATRAHECVAVG